MANWAQRATNYTTKRAIYPSAAGANIGQVGSANTPHTNDPGALLGTQGASGGSMDANPAVAAGGWLGQPVTWYLALIVVFFALQFVAKRAGEGDDFRNIRLSSYNILTMTLASALGIVTMKLAFSKFNVPGLSAFWAAV